MERKPSEIFLDLWHQVSLGQMEREDFIECAEAWEEIRTGEQAQKWSAALIEEQKNALGLSPERQGELFGIKTPDEPKPEC